MNTISAQLREEISNRARRVASERELGRVIFDAVHSAQLDWRDLSAEDAKQLLVVALRSHRQRPTNAQTCVATSAEMSVA